MNPRLRDMDKISIPGLFPKVTDNGTEVVPVILPLQMSSEPLAAVENSHKICKNTIKQLRFFVGGGFIGGFCCCFLIPFSIPDMFCLLKSIWVIHITSLPFSRIRL